MGNDLGFWGCLFYFARRGQVFAYHSALGRKEEVTFVAAAASSGLLEQKRRFV